ncbi:hypothetical protein VNI00_017991, partial [Paramarasmius palmivorus]
DDSSDEMVLRADAVKEGYSFVPPEKTAKVWKQKAYDRFLEEAKRGYMVLVFQLASCGQKSIAWRWINA